MRELIMKQKASGNWNLADISGLLGSLTAEKIRDALASLLEDKVTSEIEAIWATAVVIAFLKVHPPLLWPYVCFHLLTMLYFVVQISYTEDQLAPGSNKGQEMGSQASSCRINYAPRS